MRLRQMNLQVLMTEVYKIVNGIGPPIMNSLFQIRCNTHNIRNFQEIFTSNRKTLKLCGNSDLLRTVSLGKSIH